MKNERKFGIGTREKLKYVYDNNKTERIIAIWFLRVALPHLQKKP